MCVLGLAGLQLLSSDVVLVASAHPAFAETAVLFAWQCFASSCDALTRKLLRSASDSVVMLKAEM